MEDEQLSQELKALGITSASPPSSRGSRNSSQDEDDMGSRVEQKRWSFPGGRTGPKGVIADYKRQQQLEYEQRMGKQQEHVAYMQANGYSSHEHTKDKEQDEDFLKHWREERMEQFKQKPSNTPRDNNNRRVLDIKEADFISLIDGAPAQTSVIIHIHEKFIPECIAVSEALQALATTYSRAIFAQIRGADLDFDPVALPTLLVYREGLLVGNHVRIVDEVRKTMEEGEEEVTPEDVEKFLKQYYFYQITEGMTGLEVKA